MATNPRRTVSGSVTALRLFAPIAGNYERWATILSLGQDPRWRRAMVRGLELAPGARVLDVAAGTGSITRRLKRAGAHVVSLDLSAPMLSRAQRRGITTAVRGSGEALPFASATFDAVTLGYLLRYVDDPLATMRELVRVVRPGGTVGMVEFGVPRGPAFLAWWAYTRVGLPMLGVLGGRGWTRVGRFLGPSIEEFYRRWPEASLVRLWEAAGLADVRLERRSLGGGVVMWGRRP